MHEQKIMKKKRDLYTGKYGAYVADTFLHHP